MKVTILAATALLTLSACTADQMASWIPESDKTPMTTQAKLKACALDEARTKVQNGTVLSQGINATANEISSTCVKKLALQSAGLDTQATQDATNALQTLMGSASNLTK